MRNAEFNILRYTEMNTKREQDLKKRTKAFAVAIVTFARALPRDWVSLTLGKQLLRAGTAVGANYRVACRARSPAEFVAKLGIVEEEADETQFWLELLVESEIAKPEAARPLWLEANELLSIVIAPSKPPGRIQRTSEVTREEDAADSALHTPHSAFA